MQRLTTGGAVVYFRTEPPPVKDDEEDVDDAEDEEETDAVFVRVGNGGLETLLKDLGGEMNALIFNGSCGFAVRSYSSIRLTRSSSEVMETKASRSSAGNWQRRCVTDEPQSSSSFGSSSVTNGNYGYYDLQKAIS